MANADALSRLPLLVTLPYVPIPGDIILLLNHLSESVIQANHIETWIDKDPLLSCIRHSIQTASTLSDSETDLTIRPYMQRHSELSVIDGWILWGSRVVIPSEGTIPLSILLEFGLSQFFYSKLGHEHNMVYYFIINVVKL